MKRKKGIFVNGEWLGGLVVIDELFRTISNISPNIIKEFIQTINEINTTEEEVKITNFQYLNQNTMIIEFKNETIAGNIQLLFKYTEDGIQIVDKKVNLYQGTQNSANTDNNAYPNNFAGNSQNYIGNNNLGYQQGNYNINRETQFNPDNPNFPNIPNVNDRQNTFERTDNFNTQTPFNSHTDWQQFQNGVEYNNPNNYYNQNYPNPAFYQNPQNIPPNPNIPEYTQEYQNYINNSQNNFNGSEQDFSAFSQEYPQNYPQGNFPQGFQQNYQQGYPQNYPQSEGYYVNNQNINGYTNYPQNNVYYDEKGGNNINNQNTPQSQQNNPYINQQFNKNIRPNGNSQNIGNGFQNNNLGNNVMGNGSQTFNNAQKGFRSQNNNTFNNNQAKNNSNNFSSEIRQENNSGIDYSGIFSNSDISLIQNLNENIEKLNEKLDKFKPEVFEKVANIVSQNSGNSSNNFGENINNNTIVNNLGYGAFPAGMGFPGMIDPNVLQEFFQNLTDPNSRLSKFYKGYMFPGAEEDNEPEQKLMTLSEYLDAEKIAMLRKKKKKRSFNIISSDKKRSNVNELEDGYFIGGSKIYKWGEPIQLDK